MNLLHTIAINYSLEIDRRILAGGAGSGPNAPCPQCGPSHSDHSHSPSPARDPISKGDQVRTKTEVTMFNKKNGNIDKVPAGTVMHVLNVLPKVGHADQMVSVDAGKKYDAEYMKLSDVEMHKPLKEKFALNPKGDFDNPLFSKPGFKPKTDEEKDADIKPVRKSDTIIKFQTADGANVTWVKPHGEQSEYTPKTMQELSTTAHPQKGNFSQIDVVKGIQDRSGYARVTRMYDTSNLPAYHQTKSGASVWVDSYVRKGSIKEVKVHEQSYVKYGNKIRGGITFSYKNSAQAVGMLKSRYGITTTLDKLRRDKKKG